MKDRNCKDRDCVELLEPESGTLVIGTSATVVVVPTALIHRGKYKLRYCVKEWEEANGFEVLLISIGDTVYPVWTKLGNPVTVGKLRRREPLYFVFSNETNVTADVVPHFTLCNKPYAQAMAVAAV